MLNSVDANHAFRVQQLLLKSKILTFTTIDECFEPFAVFDVSIECGGFAAG